MPSANAAYALHPWPAVNYGLQKRWFVAGSSWRGAGTFEHLLDLGVALEADAGGPAARVFTEPNAGPRHSFTQNELLAVWGWRRIGYRWVQRVHRIVIEQGGDARPLRLTAREFAAAQLAARGWQSRRIGAELGVAAATARGAVDRSLAKLRLVSSIQLPLLWHTLGAPAHRLPSAAACHLVFERQVSVLESGRLTAAERALVERLLRGDSYRSIAGQRGVSVRTVANQMARLHERFGVSSRAALMACLLAGPPSSRHPWP